jgi:DNA primase
MGLGISERNIRVILSSSEAVYLALDNDAAGVKASSLISKLFLSEGCLPKSIDLSPCNDPDDFLVKYSREQFDKRVMLAKPVIKLRS